MKCVCGRVVIIWPVSMAMVGGVEFPDDFLTEVKMNPSSGTGWTPVHLPDTHMHSCARYPAHTVTYVTTNTQADQLEHTQA